MRVLEQMFKHFFRIRSIRSRIDINGQTARNTPFRSNTTVVPQSKESTKEKGESQGVRAPHMEGSYYFPYGAVRQIYCFSAKKQPTFNIYYKRSLTKLLIICGTFKLLKLVLFKSTFFLKIILNFFLPLKCKKNFIFVFNNVLKTFNSKMYIKL